MWYDQQRDVVIYDTPGDDRIATSVPGAVRLHNGYVAAPATLYNLQLLRYLGFPTIQPMDQTYDWPGRYTPFLAQRVTANFLAVHPRAFVLNDMGCVGGETLIDTAYGKQRIDVLAAAGMPIPVRTITNDGPRYVEIPAPFRKGHDDLYRVTFASGRSIVVTKRHVFLTSRGWISCGKLQISEQLPVFDVYPQQSSWEPCRVRSPQDAPRLTRILRDSQGYFETLVYDEQPLSAANTDLTSVPSLVDVPARTRFEWRTDAQGNKHIRTDPTSAGPRSNLRCGAQIDQGEMGGFLSEYATRLSGNQFHISARYHLFPNPRREAHEGQELRLCIPLISATAPPFDTVAHIRYERTDDYYDMEVPVHENYVAHGLCHHNTGKTLSALWAADFVMCNNPGMRALIVAPLSTLERVWADAIFQNLLGRRAAIVLHGSAQKRKELLARDADFYIVNYDGVEVLQKELAARTDIRMCIVDEASAYRNRTTERHRVARKILASRDYLWMMTGTPTPNGPTDAYGMAKLVNNCFGEGWSSFHERTMMKISNFVWKPKEGSHAAAHKMLQPSVRFAISDCMDLPPCTVQARDVELSPDQAKAYKEMKRDLVLQAAKGPITAANEAVLRMKLIQISCGAVYGPDREIHHVDAAPRLKALRELMEQCREKIIVFAPLTSVVHMLYNELKKDYSVGVINGEVPAKQRNEIFSRFMDSANPRVLVADPGTMSHGLTLTVASTIVWYAPTDRTETYLQANKRIDRPGQTKATTIVQLAATPIEREIYRRLESNETMQGLVLALAKGKL